MTDQKKIHLSTQVLNLATGPGSDSFVTTFPCDIVKVVVSGANVDGTLNLTLDAVQTATVTVTAGAGETDTVGVTSAATIGTPTPYTAQSPAGTAAQGYVKQANATAVGSANYIGPAQPDPVPVANNVAAGVTVAVALATSTAGTVTLYLDKTAAVAPPTNLGAVGNGSSY